MNGPHRMVYKLPKISDSETYQHQGYTNTNNLGPKGLLSRFVVKNFYSVMPQQNGRFFRNPKISNNLGIKSQFNLSETGESFFFISDR